jgi:hypothetical protein
MATKSLLSLSPTGTDPDTNTNTDTQKKAGDRTKYKKRLHSKEMRSAALNNKSAEPTKFRITEHAIRSPSLRKNKRNSKREHNNPS